MIHYKCASCRAILQTDDDKRGGEETCPHCGTINIVPGGEKRPHYHHHRHHGHHHEEEEEQEQKKEPLTAAKVLKALLFAVLAAGAFAALYFTLRSRLFDPARIVAEPFIPRLAEYCALDGLKDATQDFRGSYVVGRLVLINQFDEGTRKAFQTDHRVDPPAASENVDGMWRGINLQELLLLPEMIRARHPDEVETIVWLKWSAEQDPQTTDKDPRYRIVCDISVIDKAEAKLTGRTTVKGSRPPLPETGRPEAFGTRPSKELVDYLGGLPRFNRDPWGALIKVGAK